MTRNKNRKDRIRERAAETGRNYTAASNADDSANPADSPTVTIERIVIPPENRIGLGQLWNLHQHRNLLIVGPTGAGKSVMLDHLLATYLDNPHHRFVMCDLKRTELNYLADHPQVDTYADTVPEIAAAIREVRAEVDRRAAEAMHDLQAGAAQRQLSTSQQPTLMLVLESSEFIVLDLNGDQPYAHVAPDKATLLAEALDDLVRIVTAGPEIGVHTLATVQRPESLAAPILHEMGLRLSFGWQPAPGLHALFGDAQAAAKALQDRTPGRALSYEPEAGTLSVIRVPPPASSLVAAGQIASS